MTPFEKANKRKENRKALNNFKKKFKIRYNEYEFYFFLAPIAFIFILIDKIKVYQYNKMEWNEETATKALNKILPKVVSVDETGAYCYCMQWDYYILKYNAPFFYRKWVRKYGYELHKYIKKSYQADGYEKTIEEHYDETWVIFSKNP